MTPETALKNLVKDYLNTRRDVFHFPVLQGLASFKGIPDRIAIKDGKFYGLEFKAPKGKLSPHQLEFKLEVERAGGVYIEIKTLEDVQKWL